MSKGSKNRTSDHKKYWESEFWSSFTPPSESFRERRKKYRDRELEEDLWELSKHRDEFGNPKPK